MSYLKAGNKTAQSNAWPADPCAVENFELTYEEDGWLLNDLLFLDRLSAEHVLFSYRGPQKRDEWRVPTTPFACGWRCFIQTFELPAAGSQGSGFFADFAKSLVLFGYILPTFSKSSRFSYNYPVVESDTKLGPSFSQATPTDKHFPKQFKIQQNA